MARGGENPSVLPSEDICLSKENKNLDIHFRNHAGIFEFSCNIALYFI